LVLYKHGKDWYDKINIRKKKIKDL
jgi:hypothetical protein